MLRSFLPPRYASRMVAFAFVAGLYWAIICPQSSHAKFQSGMTPQSSNWTDEHTFVIYKNERGETTCRRATRLERDRINPRDQGGSTRVIYPGAPRGRENLTALKSLQTTTGLNLLPSAGLRIVLHGTTQLEQNQTAKNAFIAAANHWEAIVATPITVVIDVDFGPTFFGLPYPHPSILGATGADLVTRPFSDLRQRLIDGASNSSEAELYNALPTTELPTEVNDVVSSVVNAQLTTPNARALGMIPDITNPDSRSLGQGDAGIGFNSAFQFDFTPDDGIGSGLTDFDSVATHEIGHALGFTSNAGDNTSAVSAWDIFRFKPARATLATFATTPRILSIGGDQVFFGNQVTTYATLELALSTGGPDGQGGDGNQSSHWKDDDLVSTYQYIGIMDPTLPPGLRRTISENDMLALDLFGYTISAPTPVRPPNDNFASAIALSESGSTNGNNVNATREAGEPAHVNFLGDKSVWYSWVSPISGQATFDTIGSNFDTTLAVYTGTSVNQLLNVAQNDDIVAGQNRVSRVQFSITAGQTYRIAIDGWNSEFGNITLNWTSSGATPTPTPTPSPSPMPTPTPTPTPPADLVIDSFVASPDPVPTTQFVNYQVVAHNAGPGPVANMQITIALPSGVSFVSCFPDCFPPSGTDGGSVSANFVSLLPGAAGSLTVSAKVNAGSGAMLTATANLSSSIQDPNPANNSATTTVRVIDLIPFTEAKKIALDPEGNHVLALRRGTVWAWGFNHFGQVGDGSNVARTSPVPVDDLMSVVDIGAGNNYSIALKSDGTVWTWGSNDHGLLGTGASPFTSVNRPVQVSSLSSVTAIAAGTDHVMALKSDGTVWVWGANSLGELGIGTADFSPHLTPLQVPGLSGIVTIVAGDHVSYAVKADGTVFGWGAAFSGKLGDGTAGFSVNSPKELPALKGMIDTASGVASTVTVKPGGSVLSFGTNFRGQLGRGLSDNGPYPVPELIPGLSAKEVSNGDAFAIVTEPAGTLKAFGRNDSGQLGLGSSDFLPHPTPVSVPGISGVFATVAGRDSVLALIGDPVAGGTIRAWGGNAFGVLGTGSNLPSLSPVVVAENLTVARPNFSVAGGSITATTVQIVCGTPGSVIHYTTNGSDPTESDPVVPSSGTVVVDHSLTLKARAFRSDFTPSAIKSATYTVIARPPLELLRDESGPGSDQAAALDLLTLLRDPFPVMSVNNLLNLTTDRNTRVIVFSSNLLVAEGEPASLTVVNLVGSNGQEYNVPAEDVRSIPNSEFMQVTFRLPDTLAPGTCTVRINSHSRTSNAGTIRIQP